MKTLFLMLLFICLSVSSFAFSPYGSAEGGTMTNQLGSEKEKMNDKYLAPNTTNVQKLVAPPDRNSGMGEAYKE